MRVFLNLYVLVFVSAFNFVRVFLRVLVSLFLRVFVTLLVCVIVSLFVRVFLNMYVYVSPCIYVCEYLYRLINFLNLIDSIFPISIFSSGQTGHEPRDEPGPAGGGGPAQHRLRHRQPDAVRGARHPRPPQNPAGQAVLCPTARGGPTGPTRLRLDLRGLREGIYFTGETFRFQSEPKSSNPGQI